VIKRTYFWHARKRHENSSIDHTWANGGMTVTSFAEPSFDEIYEAALEAAADHPAIKRETGDRPIEITCLTRL